ncbi:MAG: hypothetical protein QMD73_01870 [Rhodocyclaceae bacterium]|nr:hypothetical protein [Rhodocyclaceae bacterium]
MSLALPAWPAAAVSVKTTVANAEVVIPDVPPMQAIEAVQDALSGWIGSAPMSLKPIPETLPARPGKPGIIRGSLGGTPAEILDCSTAVAEVRREPPPTRTQMSYNGDLFQACIYPFAKGTKVWLRAVNIDAAENSITHGLFSGIAKTIRGTPGEWLTRRLNDFIGGMKKKLPAVLVERIEAPGLPVQTPDREAVAALLPPEAPAATASAGGSPEPAAFPAAQSAPASSSQPDRMARMIEARKNLTAMGLTYHNQSQFLDAVRRKDVLAVKLFLDGGGVDAGAKGTDGKTAMELAREAGAAEIVALLEVSAAPQAAEPSAPAPRLPPGALPAGMFMQPQLTPEQQAQLRQQFIEAVRRQQSQQVQ